MSVKWLLVGAGRAGGCLAAAVDRIDGARLVGIVDPAVKAFAGYPVFTSLGEALASVRPDAAMVAVPNTSQVSIAKDLVKRGIPVLVEKPVGKDREQTIELIGCASRAGVSAGVVLNQRAQRHSRWIKNLIQSGVLVPETVFISGHPPVMTGWYADISEQGAGLARMVGLHYLDLLLWWFGEPESVAEVTNTATEWRINLTFSNQCRATIELASVSQDQVSPVQIEISAEEVRLRQIGHVIDNCAGLPALPDTEKFESVFTYGPGHLTVVEEATAAVQSGKPFPVQVKDVLPALQLLETLRVQS